MRKSILLLPLTLACTATPPLLAPARALHIPVAITIDTLPVQDTVAADFVATHPQTLSSPNSSWYMQDESSNHVPGISLNKAYRDLLPGLHHRTVIVAVLDVGVDTSASDLRASLWINPKDTSSRYLYSSHDNHIEDIHGWDFIGGLDEDIETDTYEITRLYALCHGIKTSSNTGLPRPPSATCDSVDKEFLPRLLSDPSPSYSPHFDPRPIVADDYSNFTDTNYGNPDVTGPDAVHGTHVAGIIAATRDNGSGINGIADDVKIMIIRVVPDGDERDKDVANGIRYAVDNGARIINMSFGKDYSPQKYLVDSAVEYAAAHNVLLVHAAGNDSRDLDAAPSFPSATYLDSKRAATWLEVGASTPDTARLAASFSNYSASQIDIFAPGVDITSIGGVGDDHNGILTMSGTSMAAPMVTGIAALLMEYYPDLTAKEVRQIIIASAAHYTNLTTQPGTNIPVRFSTLSASGGIANAYGAISMASRIKSALGRVSMRQNSH